MMKKTSYLILFLFFSTVSVSAQNSAYFSQTEVGFLWGKGQKDWEGKYMNRTNLSMSTFHGAKINRHQVVGFSLGFEEYEEIKLLPIALGWRGFLGKENRPNLFAGLDIGGGASFLEKKEITEWYKFWYEGGMMVHPSIGVKLPARKGNWALSGSLGYKRQEVSYLQGYFDGGARPFLGSNQSSQLPNGFSSLNETNYLFHSVVFRMGVMF